MQMNDIYIRMFGEDRGGCLNDFMLGVLALNNALNEVPHSVRQMGPATQVQ